MVADKFPNGLIGLISLNPSTSPTPCYCVTTLLKKVYHHNP